MWGSLQEDLAAPMALSSFFVYARRASGVLVIALERGAVVRCASIARLP